MSDLSKANSTSFTAKEQASLEQAIELLRNYHHRVGVDGTTKDFNALNYLQGIAANTALLGKGPDETAVVTAAVTAAQTLIPCLPNQRIWVFDILLSINAATNITFQDQNGVDVLATMYAPNAGQGYSHNSVRGKPLPRGSSLLVASSNAVAYSVDASYAIQEDVAP